MKVDESIDTVRAGVSDIIQRWDLGIARACQGEQRKIMMSVDMAYGTAGAFRVIPPKVSYSQIWRGISDLTLFQVPLVLDVDIMKVENFAGLTDSQDSRSPRRN